MLLSKTEYKKEAARHFMSNLFHFCSSKYCYRLILISFTSSTVMVPPLFPQAFNT